MKSQRGFSGVSVAARRLLPTFCEQKAKAWQHSWSRHQLLCRAAWKRSARSPLVFEKKKKKHNKKTFTSGLPPRGGFVGRAAGWRGALHHRVVIAVDAGQDGVVERGRRAVRAFGGAVGIVAALAAEDLLEGRAHLLVPVGVDDGVHGRVELGQEQEELLVGQDVALRAADVEEQQD